MQSAPHVAPPPIHGVFNPANNSRHDAKREKKRDSVRRCDSDSRTKCVHENVAKCVRNETYCSGTNRAIAVTTDNSRKHSGTKREDTARNRVE